MKNLLLSSFLAFFLSACSFGHYKRLSPATADSTSLHSIFGDHFNSFLFKTNIHIYGRDFSGLLVTKQLKPSDYRVIFTTELGMKLFDFEFTDSAFTVQYCVPQFNRPALLKTIQQDIEIILMTRLKNQPLQAFTDKQNEHLVVRQAVGKFSNYYFTDKKNKQLVKIEHAKGQLKKTTFDLSNYSEDIPGLIQIQHHDLKLKIELALLKK
ncbi:MAG TPA: hypothetical protein VFF27_04975 [Bacteroidia bacterium]|jgi:hypothetical protein|nr:hypothetical protein [Bacteroidia bacterium]